MLVVLSEAQLSKSSICVGLCVEICCFGAVVKPVTDRKTYQNIISSLTLSNVTYLCLSFCRQMIRDGLGHFWGKSDYHFTFLSPLFFKTCTVQ